jgi:RHS repeat-associated protein
MTMPGRKFSSGNYRYGMNGQERSTELNENSYTAEFWQYDSRLGRRWNTDPVVKDDESPYMVFGNNPIVMIDPNGADWYKNEKTGAYEWFEGSGSQKGYEHMKTGTWSERNANNISYYFGDSKDGLIMDSGNPLSEVVIGEKRKARNTLADRAFGWANFNKAEAKKWQRNLWDYQTLRKQGVSAEDAGANYEGLGATYERYYQAEQDWRAMNYAILDFGTFFVPVPKVGMLRWLGKGVGYVGKGYTQTGLKVFGEKFLKYHPRLTNIGLEGLGKGQFDAGHRAATFLKSEILEAGKWGVQSWRTVYKNLEVGSQTFSIGINPWTREIFHMAPGFYK